MSGPPRYIFPSEEQKASVTNTASCPLVIVGIKQRKLVKIFSLAKKFVQKFGRPVYTQAATE